jgi:hypothetical protein
MPLLAAGVAQRVDSVQSNGVAMGRSAEPVSALGQAAVQTGEFDETVTSMRGSVRCSCPGDQESWL